MLFDVDDTLVDTRGAFRHALAAAGADYLDAPDPEELVRVWRADAGGWYRAHTRGEMTHREQRHRRVNELHALFGGPRLDDEAYATWSVRFDRHFRDGWAAHDDAAGALGALDLADLPYGALSNADVAVQEAKLDACGLDVRMLVGVDTLGFGKPDPRVFHLACELLGFEPGEVAYVGDEFDADAVGALDAGLASVWLDRPGHHPRPVAPEDVATATARGVVRISTLAELPERLGLG